MPEGIGTPLPQHVNERNRGVGLRGENGIESSSLIQLRLSSSAEEPNQTTWWRGRRSSSALGRNIIPIGCYVRSTAHKMTTEWKSSSVFWEYCWLVHSGYIYITLNLHPRSALADVTAILSATSWCVHATWKQHYWLLQNPLTCCPTTTGQKRGGDGGDGHVNCGGPRVHYAPVWSFMWHFRKLHWEKDWYSTDC